MNFYDFDDAALDRIFRAGIDALPDTPEHEAMMQAQAILNARYALAQMRLLAPLDPSEADTEESETIAPK